MKDESKLADGILKQEKEQYWKRILIVDDDFDITTTFKVGIESANKGIGVYMYL
jgi:hypothetical protein